MDIQIVHLMIKIMRNIYDIDLQGYSTDELEALKVRIERQKQSIQDELLEATEVRWDLINDPRF